MLADEKIKLPRSSYQELVKIISAYGRYDDPVSLDRVSKTAVISSTRISANVAFLTAIDILEPGQKKKATFKGRRLAHALEHTIEEEIVEHWREIIHSSDFLSRLLASVSIRGGMDETTLEAHIAYSAGESKRPAVMTGARTVIDMLRAAGFLTESDGKLTVSMESEQQTPKALDGQPSTVSLFRLGGDGDVTGRPAVQVTREPGSPSVSVAIQIRIDCKPAELEGLGATIRDLLREIAADDSPGSEVDGTPSSDG